MRVRKAAGRDAAFVSSFQSSQESVRAAAKAPACQRSVLSVSKDEAGRLRAKSPSDRNDARLSAAAGTAAWTCSSCYAPAGQVSRPSEEKRRTTLPRRSVL